MTDRTSCSDTTRSLSRMVSSQSASPLLSSPSPPFVRRRAVFASHIFAMSTPLPICVQLFYSFFKTLVGKEIAVELKNDVALTGTLHSVDQYLNIKLNDVNVVDAEKYPQLVRTLFCFGHV